MARPEKASRKHVSTRHVKPQVNGISKKKGRPRTWTGHLQRKMIWLYLFSDLTNTMMAEQLEDTSGVRTMQEYRRELLSSADLSWRPRDRSHMYQRLVRRHRYAQFSPWMHDGSFSCSSSNQNVGSDDINKSDAAPAGPTPSHEPCMITITASKSRGNKGSNVELAILLTIEHTPGSRQTQKCLWSDLPTLLPTHLQQERIESTPDASKETSVHIHSMQLVKAHNEAWHRTIAALEKKIDRLAINRCGLQSHHIQSFKAFSNLRYLNLRRNKLRALGELPSALEVLDISQNAFKQFPLCLRDSRSLGTLQFSHNAIRKLPVWIGRMSSLTAIIVDGNPFDIQTRSLVDYAQTVCGFLCNKDPKKYCKTAFTRLLKRQLLQEAGQHPNVSAISPTCICLASVRNPASTSDWLPMNRRPLSTGMLELQNLCDPVDSSMDLDFKSASVRSSGTSITLGSIASANSSVASLQQRLSWQSLMLVHCCARQVYTEGRECLHRKLSSWLSAGAMTPPLNDLVFSHDSGGNNALHFAVLLNAPVAAINKLIEHGCDTSHSNIRGETFLHLANTGFWRGTRADLIQLVRILRERNFPFSSCDHEGNTIFHNALMIDSELNLFLAEYSWFCRNMRNSSGHLPPQLHDILYHEQLSTDEFFIVCNEYNDSTSFDKTALAVPRYLITDQLVYNHSLHDPCNQQVSVLHQFALAIFHNHRKFQFHDNMFPPSSPDAFLQFLLGFQHDVNAYDDTGRTVLMVVIRAFYHQWPQHKHQETNSRQAECCISMLLKAGADVHRRDRTGNTALHYAINYCAPPIVRSLVEHGASVDACNSQGVSVLRLFHDKQAEHSHALKVSTQFEQCLTVLLDHDAQIEPSIEQQLMAAQNRESSDFTTG